MPKFIKVKNSRGDRLLINVAGILRVRDTTIDNSFPHGDLMPGCDLTSADIQLWDGSITPVTDSFNAIEAEIAAICDKKGQQ